MLGLEIPKLVDRLPWQPMHQLRMLLMRYLSLFTQSHYNYYYNSTLLGSGLNMSWRRWARRLVLCCADLLFWRNSPYFWCQKGCCPTAVFSGTNKLVCHEMKYFQKDYQALILDQRVQIISESPKFAFFLTKYTQFLLLWGWGGYVTSKDTDHLWFMVTRTGWWWD